MTSKTGWPDNQRRPPPHGRVLASGTNVTNPSVGPFNVGAYQALGIYCDSSATFDIVWTAIGSTVQTTRSVDFDGSTLYQVIANQGQHIVSIDVTGAGITYSVTESNLPLPPSTPTASLVPIAEVHQRNLLQTIASNTPTLVNYGVDSVSAGTGILTAALSPGKITCLVSGVYAVWAQIEWPSFAGDRYLEITFSGKSVPVEATAWRARGAATPDDDIQIVSGIFAGGTFGNVTVQVTAYQNSGVGKVLNASQFAVCQIGQSIL